MTVQNAQRLLAHYQSVLDNPSSTQDQRTLAAQALANMQANLARRGLSPKKEPSKSASSSKK